MTFRGARDTIGSFFPHTSEGVRVLSTATVSDLALVSPNAAESDSPRAWTIEEAEVLICSLAGVLSARIVARPGGEILEVHLLTTEEVSPKQTVRNVESALRAEFDLTLDHRKISVAQTSRPTPLHPGDDQRVSLVREESPAPGGGRILFKGHRVDTDQPHRVAVRVTIEWDGDPFEGTATAADLPKPRIEALAGATLRAVEALVAALTGGEETRSDMALGLDGVKLMEAFDREYVLVVVHALSGREIVGLSGCAAVENNLDRATVMATLQATDRWVRGKLT